MKSFKIEVEVDIPEDFAASFLVDLYKQRREITPPEIIQEQRELLDLVRGVHE